MTLIIAEIGSNFHSLNECAQAIASAKTVGADAVKFQMASEVELYGYNAGLGIDKHFIKPNWLPMLKEKADACGIEFMCTAFSAQGYAQVNKYVKRHKIASCDNLEPGILNSVNSYKKPVIISLGSTHLHEAAYIKEKLDQCELTFMYCEVEYPCSATRLEVISAIIRETNCIAGFSDHSLDYTCAPIEAITWYNACVIEKHYNPLNLEDTPDAPHSLNPVQFQEMVKRIRGKMQEDIPMNQSAILMHRRRIKCVKPIKKGEVLTKENIGVYRSLKPDLEALSPVVYEKLLGLESPSDFDIGDGIFF
jgi:N-acetylneuraminate synthase